jgi:hypothetical protein
VWPFVEFGEVAIIWSVWEVVREDRAGKLFDLGAEQAAPAEAGERNLGRSDSGANCAESFHFGIVLATGDFKNFSRSSSMCFASRVVPLDAPAGPCATLQKWIQKHDVHVHSAITVVPGEFAARKSAASLAVKKAGRFATGQMSGPPGHRGGSS